MHGFVHTRRCGALLVTLLAVSHAPVRARAHCDSLEGPVVGDARAALQQGDVTPVLKWVAKDEEPGIRRRKAGKGFS